MRFLLATDGSAYAEHATQHLADLCRRLKEDSEVVAVYVKDVGSMTISAPAEPDAEAYFDVQQTQEAMDISASAALAAAERGLQGAATQVRVMAPWGRPPDTICDIAEDEQVDLVVVGSRGMGRLTGMFLGSVSDRVIHRSTRPVMVVRGAPEA